MRGKIQLTGRIIAAARTLAGIGQVDFAGAANIPVESLRNMEANGSAWIPEGPESQAVRGAIEKFGVIILNETRNMGAGVRLKFTRQDVRQIARLEGEGGIVRSDDAP